MNTRYALVDCNSFYCSCERLFRPDLARKPVVVLSNNDGCVIARSKEAKDLGIDMAGPFYKWRKFCQQNGVSWFSSNYALYGDISSRVMEVLQQFCPSIEQYSIDEAFLDLRGMKVDLDWARRLHETVLRWTGIPVSVGIGATKTLAKIANNHGKKTGSNAYIISEQTQLEDILDGKELTSIWGVGWRGVKKLNRYGIWTALDLKKSEPLFIRKKFSIVLERTVRELNGEACIGFEPEIAKRKNIQVSRSFGTLLAEYAELEQALVSHATRAAEKLREQGSLTSAVYVYLRTNPHREGGQYSNGSAAELIVPTATTFEIVEAATRILPAIYREGYEYQKVGVMLLDLVDQGMHTQQDMFGITESICKKKELMGTLDKINKLYGRSTLHLASEGTGGGKWKLRSQYRSPRYTTDWNDLPRVS